MNEKQRLQKQLTPESMVYLAILLLAVLLRFVHLGRPAMNDHEAGLALQALKWAAGESPLLSGEPGYLSLTAALFFVFRSTEFLARFWPALAGSLVVLLPLFIRESFGKLTALILAFLLALDPILIAGSRSAEGSMLALLGLLAGLGFWFKKRAVLSGFCLGVAFLGGPGVWFGTLALVIVLMIFRKASKQGFSEAQLWQPSGKELLLVVAAAMTTLTVTSTLFFTYPRGLSAIGASFAEFPSSWESADGMTVSGVLIAWSLTLLPLILIAGISVIDGFIRGDKRVKWLAVWALVALLLVVANPSRQLNDLFWVSIPLLLLGAIKIAAIFSNWKVDNSIVTIAEAGLTVSLVVFSFFNGLYLLNNLQMANDEYRNRIIGMILPLILLVGLTVLLAWGWSEISTRKGLAAGVVILSFFMVFAGAWKATGLTNPPGFEFSRGAGTPITENEFMSTLHDLSRSKTGIENRIDILQAGLTMPSVEWLLRDFENLSSAAAINPKESHSVVLTPADVILQTDISYRGQKFRWAIAPLPEEMNFTDWMKWWVFRTAPVEETNIILWARNDLFPGGATP